MTDLYLLLHLLFYSLLSEAAKLAEDDYYNADKEQDDTVMVANHLHGVIVNENKSLATNAVNWQAEAVADVAENVLEGKGSIELMKSDIKKNPEILLVAPTGKAANLLGKRSMLPAFTLHHVIYSYYSWRRKCDNFMERPIWSFSMVRALVVDECSLVAVTTFQALLSALVSSAHLEKVVLLGDVDQLPSIEPGWCTYFCYCLCRFDCVYLFI